MIRLTTDAIDYAALTESVCRPDCGGVVLFLGTVRDLTDGRVTDGAGIRGLFRDGGEEISGNRTRDAAPLAGGRDGVGPPSRPPRRRRGERGRGRKLSASRRSVRGVSLRYRPSQGNCAFVEKENWADGSTEWVHPSKIAE